MGLKKRRKFNAQWRKDRKVLKAARKAGPPWDNEAELRTMAAKYNINFPAEPIK